MTLPDAQEATATTDVIDGVIVLTVTGTIDTADMRRFQDQVRRHPAYQAGVSLVADVSRCDISRLTREDIRAISQSPSPLTAGGRLALVVADDLAFGMARMFEIMRGPDSHDSQVFRDLDEALRWITSEDD